MCEETLKLWYLPNGIRLFLLCWEVIHHKSSIAMTNNEVMLRLASSLRSICDRSKTKFLRQNLSSDLSEGLPIVYTKTFNHTLYSCYCFGGLPFYYLDELQMKFKVFRYIKMYPFIAQGNFIINTLCIFFHFLYILYI